ncbi:hypothetical protein [Rhizobium jaguaris]|uniref:Uncharacterized protein n=1 Tax=Rhizobium jaguaris TaxID=1312183 RepID=A0A387GAG1_9HYPH|nr:hypothetical protein [Rhizobium jaguaris]AYG64336.1 hypothetical protein CCGE525_36905 [Rhizobium jaguaris]
MVIRDILLIRAQRNGDRLTGIDADLRQARLPIIFGEQIALAYSDEAGHRFRFEAGQSFRFHSGQRSDLKPAISRTDPGSR